VDGLVEPMELGHLPYKKATYEDYVGLRGFKRLGKKKWRKHVFDIVAKLKIALEPDDVVLGGGNVANLAELPPGCRAGNNANAFLGGFRLWGQATDQTFAAAGGPALLKVAKTMSTEAAKKAPKETKKARSSAAPKKRKKKRSTKHVEPIVAPDIAEDSPAPPAPSLEEPGSSLPEVADVASPEPVLGGSETGGAAHG